MRPVLAWALACTVAASAVALWWPNGAPAMVAMNDTVLVRQRGVPAAPAAHHALGARRAPLPAALEGQLLEPATRDLFEPFQPPAPPAPPAEPEPPPPPPPPATPPPLPYRYLGRMTTPDGRLVTLITRGNDSIPISVGTRLDEGYVVVAIDERVLRFGYREMNAFVELPVPPPPEGL